jgi:glyoxylase-like metal-dependent hydrolase (beta-lactamase superfamily II)
MKTSKPVSWLLLGFLPCSSGIAATPRFEKVSDHCYFLQSGAETANVAAVVTDDGMLLIDPPANPGPAAAALEALKRLPSRPVRWIVHTDYSLGPSGGAERFTQQGALVLGSRREFQLASAGEGVPAPAAGTAEVEKSRANSVDSRADRASSARLSFDRQMHLFPGGVEIRILAVQYKAHTGGDVVLYIPAEKVLIVGNLYVAGRYPEIDVTPGDGSAMGWLDGMKQVIDAVPLLKQAIPQKTETKRGEEKTLEESITVLSAYGGPSNLQEMKDLLEATQKLRGEVARAVRAGRDVDTLLTAPALYPFRNYEKLDPFVRLLFEELARK